MTEETEGAGAQASGAPDTSGLAIDLAMEEARNDPGLRAAAAAFLHNQNTLVDLQKHHLHEQITHLDLGSWEKRLSIALRLATLVVGIAFASAVSLMVWDAAHARGVVVEPFSMPPELTVKGITGQAVASQLLSNLSHLQSRTQSARIPSSYANNWGNDFKVAIPHAGVSLGEVRSYLREWLGNETHITGSVTQTQAGITVTAYVGSDMVPAVSGDPAGLDDLVRKLSEEIYSRTQPYRYAIFLLSPGRLKEAQTALQALAATGAAEDRFWANNGLATIYGGYLWQWDRFAAVVRTARTLRPESIVPDFFAALYEPYIQHEDAALASAKALATSKGDPDVNEENATTMRLVGAATVALLQGDYIVTVGDCRQVLLRPNTVGTQGACRTLLLMALARSHDAAGLRSEIRDMRTTVNAHADWFSAMEALGEAQLGHWSVLLDHRPRSEIPRLELNALGNRDINPRAVQPHVAEALAQSGDLEGAHAIMDRLPADCSLCLRTRGKIAALEKNWGGAQIWFERAARYAPSTPFPFTDWGRMLLDKGDADGAIAQFTLANRKGPKFADPLQGWGEALMARNQSHLALTKFAAAEKFAPNWGRLQLKWGQALLYAGKPDEAKAKFARAATLDLTPAEKAELSQQTAANP